ncbi:hypothetical protein H696_01034 [Fonticula alba]|uniref:Uncharacterized protein n=1 Tax=Fonticula alba TaxID=691883 RepID=A0A058ZDS6_FONAL|nr:hypothetical protein H696_01034 [Fonticula alba]KCV71617.1 hypothetical protein H696_01034 [Fonticula alba]|eukprot:XP_009493195.1 hypothetical protein H696_01034 [Fonticula alba]
MDSSFHARSFSSLSQGRTYAGGTVAPSTPAPSRGATAPLQAANSRSAVRPTRGQSAPLMDASTPAPVGAARSGQAATSFASTFSVGAFTPPESRPPGSRRSSPPATPAPELPNTLPLRSLAAAAAAATTSGVLSSPGSPISRPRAGKPSAAAGSLLSPSNERGLLRRPASNGGHTGLTPALKMLQTSSRPSRPSTRIPMTGPQTPAPCQRARPATGRVSACEETPTGGASGPGMGPAIGQPTPRRLPTVVTPFNFSSDELRQRRTRTMQAAEPAPAVSGTRRGPQPTPRGSISGRVSTATPSGNAVEATPSRAPARPRAPQAMPPSSAASGALSSLAPLPAPARAPGGRPETTPHSGGSTFTIPITPPRPRGRGAPLAVTAAARPRPGERPATARPLGVRPPVASRGGAPSAVVDQALEWLNSDPAFMHTSAGDIQHEEAASASPAHRFWVSALAPVAAVQNTRFTGRAVPPSPRGSGAPLPMARARRLDGPRPVSSNSSGQYRAPFSPARKATAGRVSLTPRRPPGTTSLREESRCPGSPPSPPDRDGTASASSLATITTPPRLLGTGQTNGSSFSSPSSAGSLNILSSISLSRAGTPTGPRGLVSTSASIPAPGPAAAPQQQSDQMMLFSAPLVDEQALLASLGGTPERTILWTSGSEDMTEAPTPQQAEAALLREYELLRAEEQRLAELEAALLQRLPPGP